MPAPNLGDIPDKSQDPLERIFDITRQGVNLTPEKLINRDDTPCPPDPCTWKLLMDLWTKLQCGTYFIKGPNWIEPPITARGLDLRTETCVTLNIYGLDTTIVTFTMPDRFVGTILGFGHEIEDPSQWGSIIWNIKINGLAIPGYQDFKTQIGRFVNPTLFPNPQRIKFLDKVDVTARIMAGVDACVFARLIGFIYPVNKLTQDGSFADYHTL